jgi:hypothetical protein
MSKRNGSESYAARVGKARREVVAKAADFFEASGVEYKNGAIVMETVRDELARLAALPEYAPYNVASRNQEKRVWDEVHRRWKLKQGN